MNRRRYLSFVIAAVFALTPDVASACSCDSTPVTLTERFDRAAVVMHGRVLVENVPSSVKTLLLNALRRPVAKMFPSWHESMFPRTSYEIDVLRTWKGHLPDVIDVPGDIVDLSSDCDGPRLSPVEEDVLFGQLEGGFLRFDFSPCSPPLFGNEISKALETFGAGIPNAPYDPRPKRWLGFAAVSAVVIAGLFALARLRRQRPSASAPNDKP